MMLGLTSDTHDNLPMIEKAGRILNQENVALVSLAGDYVAPFVIPKFKALNSKLIGFFANNNGEVCFPLFHIFFRLSARNQSLLNFAPETPKIKH